jgi:hypothetical protein
MVVLPLPDNSLRNVSELRNDKPDRTTHFLLFPIKKL